MLFTQKGRMVHRRAQIFRLQNSVYHYQTVYQFNIRMENYIELFFWQTKFMPRFSLNPSEYNRYKGMRVH